MCGQFKVAVPQWVKTGAFLLGAERHLRHACGLKAKKLYPLKTHHKYSR